MYWVYVLDNYTKRDFISVTIDMKSRFSEHKQEMIEAGVSPQQLTIVLKEYYSDAVSALKREKELKALTPYKLKKHIEELNASQQSI